MLGAGGTVDAGWISTDIDTLDISSRRAWRRLFAPASIDALLAEHVWEHLDRETAHEAARLCFEFLRRGGYLRVAVPDGLHPDPAYREWVRPGGIGPGADDHKVLYDYRSLEKVFADCGFRVEMLEHFDEGGRFVSSHWDAERGMIHRSKRFDKRNTSGALNYTSIIVDAFKEQE